jgi:site-specific DNA-methyltransferase (adenine-specific)
VSQVDCYPTLSECSIDACVTDPPYGIGFMGKEWDSFLPSVAAKKAGLRQYGTLPRWKENNPNLKGRKVNGAISASQIEYDRGLQGQRAFQEWTAKWSGEVYRLLKPGAHIVVCGAPRSFHRMTCGLEDAGFEVRDCLSWLYGQGFPKSLNFDGGRGTALKPGWEPIVLARKPCGSSTTEVLKRFGTGALNIDACRIGLAEGETPEDFYRVDGPDSKPRTGVAYAQDNWTKEKFKRTCERGHDAGRWPPNVCLDEDAAAMLDEQSGELVSGANPERRGPDKFRGIYGDFKGQEACEAARGQDIGGASRFFYVAKPSREERDYGTEHLIARQRDESRKAGNPGGDNPRNRGLQPRGNFHPTVKPIALTRWLVRLITPINGVVLDPFTGSGTTGMACRYEQRQFIGIEREAEYVEIAEARIAAVAPLFGASA